MTKVRVQDATKELSAGTGKLLESFGKTKRQALDMLQTLKKLSDDMTRQEAERKEQQAKEALSKEYEAAAAFMTAYSTEQVPEPVKRPAEVVVKPLPVEEVASKNAEPVVEASTQKQPVEAKRSSSEERTKPSIEKTAENVAVPQAQISQPKPQTANRAEKPVIEKPVAEKPVQAAEAPPAPERTAQPQQQNNNRPAAPQGQQGQYGRPIQQRQTPQGQQQYGRPVQSQQQNNPQGPYGRPVQQGQAPQGQYGRPVQQGQAPQGQYGRPVQQGQQNAQGPYGRPVQPAGQYGRPVQQGQAPQGQGQYGRPASQGQYGRPVSPAQGQGQHGRPAPQGGRPGMGGGAGPARPGSAGGSGRPGFGRKVATELTPVVEKERVSNYDPNKKQYIRQNDPERNKGRSKANRTAVNAGMEDEFVRGGKKKKKLQPFAAFRPEPIKIEKAYMTAETITVKDLTERIGKPAGEIIKKLLLLGVIATINNELDYDTAQLVCSEFGIGLEMKLDKTAEDELEEEDFQDEETDLEVRPPVVTIMGHVDHGKTTLLDYIRNAHVTASEAGGITQHIGAYTVDADGQKITFLDTPGHEAFTSMRARGAQVTDIAILVVSAEDGVMPQTVEAINHAKAAGVETMIAINKIDRPTANVDRVRQELTEYGLVAEDWGGDTIMVPVSAITGENVDQLLEMILLVSEMQNYRANPNRKARGAIIEARLDKGRGPVATVLIKNGTLRVGDTIVAGTAYGRVRAMVNDRGEHVRSAGPSDPVEVIGFNDVPDAGDIMSAVDDDKLSRQVAEERKDKLRAALVKTQQKTSLEDLFGQISVGQVKDLNIIIKADVQGSVEAVKQSLEKLSNEEVRVRAIHGGVGAITESDVMLASASNAIIIGFNVRHDNNVRDVAERESIDIRLYRVIYNAIEDVENAMKGLLAPKFKEIILGRAQVRQPFKVSGVGTIAGSYVTDGKIVRNGQVRLLRDNIVVHEGKIDSLKRFKDDAREVASGYECGIGIENYNDIKENDVIECFSIEEIAR